jgi:hypothetical protein
MAEWFLARDGQQFGPVSDVEFRKLVELGHLRPTDLVWREGLPEWKPASDIVPQYLAQRQPEAAAPQQQHVAPAPRYAEPAAQSMQNQSMPQVEQRADQRNEPRPRPRTVAPDPVEPTHYSASGYGPSNMDARTDRGQERGQERGLVIDPGAGAPAQRIGASRAKVADRSNDAPRPSRLATVGRWIRRAAVLVFFTSTLSAAAWYAYPHRGDIMRIASAVTGGVSGGGSSVPVLGGFSADAGASDTALQKVPLWRVLKRDYPEWYGARVKEASELSRTGKPEAAVAMHVADALAKLRRQYAGDALSATPVQLQAVATSFAESLTRLRKHSVDACYKYISSGESNPDIVPLLQTADPGGPLQKQLLAVFSAVSEGRKTPRVYPPPKQSDYDVLVKELEARGWTQADMQLFSDSRALAKATPEKVCSMVTQWFESQIAIKDQDVQLRLLVDSLRPVVAG